MLPPSPPDSPINALIQANLSFCPPRCLGFVEPALCWRLSFDGLYFLFLVGLGPTEPNVSGLPNMRPFFNAKVSHTPP